MRVFLSYARIDETVGTAIAGGLDGLSVAYVRHPHGPTWREAPDPGLVTELRHCTDLLLVLSPASTGTDWLPYEVGLASALGHRILVYIGHPSLEWPGFLPGAHHAVSMGDVRRFFVPSHRTEPVALVGLRDRIDINARQRAAEAAARLALDKTLLFFAIAPTRTRPPTAERSAELHGAVERARLAWTKDWLEIEPTNAALEARITVLDSRLRWLVARTISPPGNAVAWQTYFDSFRILHADLVVLVNALQPTLVSTTRKWVEQADLEAEAPTTLDAFIALRHRLQGALIESGQLQTIWDDVEHQLAVPFMVIDDLLLARFPPSIVGDPNGVHGMNGALRK